MKPAEYIQDQLNKLNQVKSIGALKSFIVEQIVAKILSKKFRKYAVDSAFTVHVKKVVKTAVEQNKPIVMVWVFGGYKLWRIPTTPSVDYAELFSMIYFAKYAKSIAEIYHPGVVFDFFSDDVIVSQMDNVPQQDIDNYLLSFRKLLAFFTPYLPKNVKFVFNRVAEQYGEGEFEKELNSNIDKLENELPNGMPKMDDVRKALVDLNVKIKPGQDGDPNWREKVLLIHDAYAMSSKRRPYYRNENKIMVVNTSLPGALAIGTTKASVAKFWCGMGVLEKRGDGYIEKVLSPKQIEGAEIKMEKIKIKGLNGRNFEEIGIV